MTPDAVRAAVEECKRLADEFAKEFRCYDGSDEAKLSYSARHALHVALAALASLHAPDAVSPELPAEPLGAPASPSGSPFQPPSGASAAIPGASRSLLREPVKNIGEISKNIQGGCYCPPDRCSAPIIHGRQTPCLRRPAARGIDSPEGVETVPVSTAKLPEPGRDSGAPESASPKDSDRRANTGDKT